MSLILAAGYVLLCAVVVIASLFVALFLFAISGALYARNLKFKLPWMKWLTLDDMRALGHSKIMSRIALDILRDHGYLECRQLGDLPEEARERAETDGFKPWTAQFFEFRLIKRTGRLRPKLLWNPLGGLSPSRA